MTNQELIDSIIEKLTPDEKVFLMQQLIKNYHKGYARGVLDGGSRVSLN